MTARIAPKGQSLGLRLSRAAAAAALVALMPSAGALAASWAVVVGIDDYVGEANDLAGAVNDANDISQALSATGATVITLTDDAATKAAIEAAWLETVEKAAPGDTVVFSYAGHGSQEPEPVGRGGEDDGLNENFLLGGYQPTGPGTVERIVDDEIFEWLKMADEKGLEVVFVADSCHSGTMYRDTGSRVVRYRTGSFTDPDLGADLLALPDPTFARTREADFSTVTFIGSVQENKLTPELMINGEPRGALSWAFSRAVEGAADKNGDGALSQQELLAYLVPTVEMQSENQQIPSVLPLGAEEKPIIAIAAGAGAPRIEPVIVAEADVLVTLFIRGSGIVPPVPGVSVVRNEGEADLIWDPVAGTVDHRIGGRVAESVDGQGIAAVLSKWSALGFMRARAAAAPVNLSLPSGNQTYHLGEEFQVSMTGATLPYLTLFNLPPDGRVEFFIPANRTEALTDWTGRILSERLRVQNPPFGAEHLVAILTAEPATALHAALAQMGTADNAAGLAATLSNLLGDQSFQAGVLGIYTSAEQ